MRMWLCFSDAFRTRENGEGGSARKILTSTHSTLRLDKMGMLRDDKKPAAFDPMLPCT